MKKIAINKCFGGFSLSHKAVMLYAELSGFKLYPFQDKRDPNGDISSFGECIRWDGKGKPPFIIYYLREDDWSMQNEPGVYFASRDIKRDDPNLIKVIEQLGNKADGSCARLSIVEIPDDVIWDIAEYDGQESVVEQHRSWR